MIPKRVMPTFACLFVFILVYSCLPACMLFWVLWGLLFDKSYTRIWGTLEIGWMIFRVDLIGEFPYRVDLSLRPLGRGLLEGDDVSALLLST